MHPISLTIRETQRHGCQAESLEAASRRKSRIADLLDRAAEQYRREGVGRTVRKVLRFLLVPRGTDHAEVLPHSRAVVAQVLDLRPGELVQVKSLEEIQATLDEEGKLRGLQFLPSMHEFCGKRYAVFKRMETLYSEETGVVRRLKNTVLLKDVQCDGLLMRCDRSCYFYWREAWLKRVTPYQPVSATRSDSPK